MYDITVFGNSPVDMLTHVEEDFIKKYNLNKADFNPIDAETFIKIAEECTFEGMEAGGSCANTAWALGKLNKNVYFIGHVGEDPSGKHFFNEMQNADITMPIPQENSNTMEIFVLITPDGERTFVSRGVTAFITPEMIQKDILEKSNWLLLEGYTLLDQEESVVQAIELAKKSNCKIAFTISADFVIHVKHELIFKKILPNLDLFISNDEEYAMLQGYIEKLPHDQKAAINNTLNSIDLLITHNKEGASFTRKGQETFVPTTAKKVLDATGAGDAFAAGFLSKYIEDEIALGLTLGHLLAGEVISQLGGRLKDWSKISTTPIQKTA